MVQIKPGDNPIRRIVKVYGVESPVVLQVAYEGITLSIKGAKIPLTLSWVQVAEAAKTPGNVPSFLEGRGLEYLKHTAKKQNEARIKRTLKKSAA